VAPVGGGGSGAATGDGGPAAPLVFALLSDPLGPGRRAQLEAAIRGRRAALGPAVDWPDAEMSFARAVATLRVVPPNEDGGLLLADDHRLEILLGQDRRLADDMARDALRDLDAETQASRERLLSTLEAWLRHRGRTEEVARALHVHPQTVRYRMGRLRELLGDRLDDPDGRFELELALRARPDGGRAGE
jgi:DNA-binding PucR family transcriptional regulator